MNYFKIQPDNLTNKEKKVTYFLLIICLIIAVVFFGIIKKNHNYESAIRKGKDFISTECEIIGYGAKFNSSIFKYNYRGEKYNSRQHNTDDLQIGEKYRGRLNKNEPEVAIMLLNEPVIDTSKYKKTIARIKKIEPKKYDLNLVTYLYEINNQKYSRTEFMNKFFKWKKGENVSILYKINNPKISYIEKETGGNKS
ncbi:hypothetical protein GCQ56_09090 [Marinifilum sp. N1E240]|uniref:hypothetical protein n=1 Tax=Marinifilum sp. N1E240 TaxID=2608082 RepID=UPI00128E2018|nr:hypothetical protein [Marinifilum sp. N1E240]MPQ47172.1 hypothetical protein [Marinifilum sp. N1E240]